MNSLIFIQSAFTPQVTLLITCFIDMSKRLFKMVLTHLLIEMLLWCKCTMKFKKLIEWNIAIGAEWLFNNYLNVRKLETIL